MNLIYIISPYPTDSPEIQPTIILVENTLKKYWGMLSIRQRLKLSEILPRHGQDANQDLFYNGDGLNIQVESLPSIVFIKGDKIEAILTQSDFEEKKIIEVLQRVYAKPPWPQWIWWLGLTVGGIGTFKSEKPISKGSSISLSALSAFFLNRNKR